MFYNGVSNVKQHRIAENAIRLGYALDEYTFVYVNDLNGNESNPNNRFLIPRLIDEASRRAVWHLMTLILPLTGALGQLADIAQSMGIDDIPYMSEFYGFLRGAKRTRPQ